MRRFNTKNGKTAGKLQKGDVLASGEVVLTATTGLGFTQNKVVNLTLKHPKKDKVRNATYGYYNTIWMKRQPA